MRHKRALVRTLFHRLRRIVSDDRLDSEIELLRATLIDNGYPLKFIQKHSHPVAPKVPLTTVPRKPVYLALPFKGDNVSALIKRRLDAAIQRTFYSARLVFIEETTRVPATPRKDPVTLFAKSNIIYEFDCICGCRYVGRTSRHLGTRINEHIPKWLTHSGIGLSKSAITKHLKETGHIVDTSAAFKVIYQPKRRAALNVAEAVAINRLSPDLCAQKQFIRNLELPW